VKAWKKEFEKKTVKGVMCTEKPYAPAVLSIEDAHYLLEVY
jgi:hypothetical protein